MWFDIVPSVSLLVLGFDVSLGDFVRTGAWIRQRGIKQDMVWNGFAERFCEQNGIDLAGLHSLSQQLFVDLSEVFVFTWC